MKTPYLILLLLLMASCAHDEIPSKSFIRELENDSTEESGITINFDTVVTDREIPLENQ